MKEGLKQKAQTIFIFRNVFFPHSWNAGPEMNGHAENFDSVHFELFTMSELGKTEAIVTVVHFVKNAN